MLQPDIVIAMNLKDHLCALGDRTEVGKCEDVWAFSLSSNGHLSLLLDTWHFSAPDKTDEKNFYAPICEMVRTCLPKLVRQ